MNLLSLLCLALTYYSLPQDIDVDALVNVDL
jgi:hypothetical protein